MIVFQTELLQNITNRAGSLRRRLANLTYELEETEKDLGSLDARIKERSDKIATLEDKVTAGDYERRLQSQRYIARTNATKTSIQAANWVIDQLGGSTAATDTFKAALNEAFKSENGAATPTSFLELAEMLKQASDQPESDNLDYLRDLMGELYANLHDYARMIDSEEGHRSYVWAQAKFWYQNRSQELQAEINNLESTRVPNRQKVADCKEEIPHVKRTRIYVKAHYKKAKGKLDRLEVAIDKITEDYKKQRQARSQQLDVVAELMDMIVRHLSTTVSKPMEAFYQPNLS